MDLIFKAIFGKLFSDSVATRIDRADCNDIIPPMIEGETFPEIINCTWERSNARSFVGEFSFKLIKQTEDECSISITEQTSAFDRHGFVGDKLYEISAYFYLPIGSEIQRNEVGFEVSETVNGIETSTQVIGVNPIYGAWQRLRFRYTANSDLQDFQVKIYGVANIAVGETFFVDNFDFIRPVVESSEYDVGSIGNEFEHLKAAIEYWINCGNVENAENEDLDALIQTLVNLERIDSSEADTLYRNRFRALVTQRTNRRRTTRWAIQDAISYFIPKEHVRILEYFNTENMKFHIRISPDIGRDIIHDDSAILDNPGGYLGPSTTADQVGFLGGLGFTTAPGYLPNLVKRIKAAGVEVVISLAEQDEIFKTSDAILSSPDRSFNFSSRSLSITEGNMATVQVSLNAAPSSDVTVAISLSDETRLTTNVNELTFTPDNYFTSQSVVLSSSHDDDHIDHQILVTFTASGGDYDATETVSVMLMDDDMAGILLSQTSISLIEGSNQQVTARLNTQPTGSVTLSIVSDDTSAVTAGVSSLIFTTNDWSTPKSVNIEAISDSDADDETVMVTFTGSGGGYTGVVTSLQVNTTDTDIPNEQTDLPSISNLAFDFNEVVNHQLPEAIEGNAPFVYSLTGLSSGLSFNATTRRITGTVDSIGTLAVVYSATDLDGEVDTENFNIVLSGINPAAPATASVVHENDDNNLSWDLPSHNGGSNILTYRIDVSTDNITFALLANVTAPTRTFSHEKRKYRNNLLLSNLYYYFGFYKY